MAKGRSLILFLAALGFMVLSALTLFWNKGWQAPQFVGTALQEHPDRVMTAEAREFGESLVQAGSVDTRRSQSFLAKAPLEEEPFVIAGANLDPDQEIERSESLLRIAVRRNPRSREARLLLLDRLARRGDVTGAVAQVEVLTRLLPSEGRAMMSDALVALVNEPSLRRETLAAIEGNTTKLEMLRALSRNGANASVLLESIETLGQLDLGERRDDFVASLVNPLLRAGDWQGALRVWTYFNPTASAGDDLVLDPQFAGEFGPPFGWEVRSNSNGYARLGDRGLEGEFYGRSNTELARQVLFLDPGDYSLTIRSETLGEGIRLLVACPQEGTILEEPLDDRSKTMQFSLTGDCPAPALRILGRASDPPRASAFAISEIELERASND